ncbi:hypothetical protein THAOC_06613 [Thalassiosira oceanica]|uniref:Uncharacterized protein n=1 Tax=Thalassiosira oceanica TaxID=159749 RepID=K0SZU1_THAOC|nr:hypothetical protein THAOC_06613 [Thalassiosira oceanica]|eukprot:EJK71903.1 hypothetical protein THAOC_06613 [Thalassiosira oceanica]
MAGRPSPPPAPSAFLPGRGRRGSVPSRALPASGLAGVERADEGVHVVRSVPDSGRIVGGPDPLGPRPPPLAPVTSAAAGCGAGQRGEDLPRADERDDGQECEGGRGEAEPGEPAPGQGTVRHPQDE